MYGAVSMQSACSEHVVSMQCIHRILPSSNGALPSWPGQADLGLWSDTASVGDRPDGFRLPSPPEHATACAAAARLGPY